MRQTGEWERPYCGANHLVAGELERQLDTNDSILTALEASGLNLIGTDLVVLSACQTGGWGRAKRRRCFRPATCFPTRWRAFDRNEHVRSARQVDRDIDGTLLRKLAVWPVQVVRLAQRITKCSQRSSQSDRLGISTILGRVRYCGGLEPITPASLCIVMSDGLFKVGLEIVLCHRSPAEFLGQLLTKLQSRILAIHLEHMVHRYNFRNHCDILAR